MISFSELFLLAKQRTVELHSPGPKMVNKQQTYFFILFFFKFSVFFQCNRFMITDKSENVKDTAGKQVILYKNVLMPLTSRPKRKVPLVIKNEFLGSSPELQMCLFLRKSYNHKVLNNHPLKICPFSDISERKLKFRNLRPGWYLKIYNKYRRNPGLDEIFHKIIPNKFF